MNIETANRLVQYRKTRGLSQEALADSLGLSRQAVSKWERAEASPDTDNLLALARLYGVSLDELLGNIPTAQPVPEPALEPAAQTVTAAPFAEYDRQPQPAFGQGFEQELEQKLEAELLEAISEDKEEPGPLDHLSPGARKLLGLMGIGAFIVFFLGYGILSKFFPDMGDMYPLVCTVIYLVGGFVLDWWHPGWMIYLSVPFFYTIFW